MKLSKVSKNTIALFTSQVYNKFTAAIFFFIAARILGVTNFGKYTLVITFISFFYILSDWGLSTLTMRDVARSPDETKKYLTHTIIPRIGLALISYLVLLGIAIILSYPKEIVVLITIIGLSLFPNNILNSFNAILNAHEKMHIPSIMCMIFNTIFLILGALCLYLNLGLAMLVLVSVPLSLINSILTGYFLKKFLKPFRLYLEYAFCKKLFKEATPFAILSSLSIIYFRVDAIMLSKLQTIEVVGLYNAAYKIVEFLMFIPASLVMAYFPQMSRHARSSITELRKSYVKTILFLLMIIVPIAIFCTFFAKYIILFLFGKPFIPASSALKILIWAVVVMFVNAPFGNILYNSNKILKYIPYQVLLTLLNITINFILIPKWSFLGASYTTLITEIIAFSIQIWFIKHILFSQKQ